MRVWLTDGLRAGAVVAIAGGLLWLLVEGRVGQLALLRSALWTLVVWVVSGIVWVGLQCSLWYEAAVIVPAEVRAEELGRSDRNRSEADA